MRTGNLNTRNIDAQIVDIAGLVTAERLDQIENNIMMLAFYRSIDNSKSIYSLDNAFMDEFEDQTGIDTGNSLNQSYNDTDDYYMPQNQGIDSYTKLMLHGEGAPTISHAITVNGGAQISTAQSKFGGSSLYFDGSGDYLSISNSSDWDFGTGDFTIDFWVRPTTWGVTGDEAVISTGNSGSDSARWLVRQGTSGKIQFSILDGSGATTFESNTSAITINIWQHVSIVRDTNTLRFFVDGVAKGTADITSRTVNSNGSGLILGKFYITVDNYYFTGYLDEVRISKGIARWTSSFTPNTIQYEPDQYTVLLIHGDGSNGSTNIVDSVGGDDSGTYKKVTMNGNARLSYNSKIGNGCAIFDGTGDYITVPDSDDWNFGTGDFTVDFWIRFNSIASNNCIMQQLNGSVYWQIMYQSGIPGFRFQAEDGIGGSVIVTNTITASINTWYHVALVRNGTSWIVYVNGVAGSSTTSSFTMPNSTSVLNIGTDLGGGSYYVNGCIDELRISKGIARWTSGFTPSTTAYTSDSYTKLLLHFEDLTDSGNTGHTLTVNGDVHIEGQKFGNSSLYFDGSGDYITLADSDDWYFGTGNFTVECWVKFDSLTGFQEFFHQRIDDNNYSVLRKSDSNSMYMDFVYASSVRGRYVSPDNYPFAVNTWYHIAFVRNGSTGYIFINGTALTLTEATAFGSNDVGNLSSDLNIGRWNTGSNYLKGSIDEYRISKGIARYTSNFTPQTSAFSSSMQNMTLQSAVQTAQVSPTSARVVLFEEDVDSITVNTDLKAYMSRDNGSTWLQMTLEDDGSYSGTKRILTSDPISLNVSGLGSGTNLKYKLTTHNNKNLKIHGVGLSWL